MASLTSSRRPGCHLGARSRSIEHGPHALVEVVALQAAAGQPEILHQRGAQIERARQPHLPVGDLERGRRARRQVLDARLAAQVAAAPRSARRRSMMPSTLSGREAARDRRPQRLELAGAGVLVPAVQHADRPDRHRRGRRGSRRSARRECNASPAPAGRRRPGRSSARSAPDTCRSRRACARTPSSRRRRETGRCRSRAWRSDSARRPPGACRRA